MFPMFGDDNIASTKWRVQTLGQRKNKKLQLNDMIRLINQKYPHNLYPFTNVPKLKT